MSKKQCDLCNEDKEILTFSRKQLRGVIKSTVEKEIGKHPETKMPIFKKIQRLFEGKKHDNLLDNNPDFAHLKDIENMNRKTRICKDYCLPKYPELHVYVKNKRFRKSLKKEAS